MSNQGKGKVVRMCSYQNCGQDATWKAKATKKDIEKVAIDDVKLDVRPLLKEGTWYYCDKHKDTIGAYCPHLKFERL